MEPSVCSFQFRAEVEPHASGSGVPAPYLEHAAQINVRS
jgi:hypothetical protein